MESWLADNEGMIRLTAFFGVFAIMAVWELAAPRRPLTGPKGIRWFSNLAIVVIDTLCVRLAMPVVAVGAAEFAANRGIGLFNLIDVGALWALVLSFVLLDFVIYLQHVMFHAVPVFWRLHLVHHADEDIDVTTGLRFHPVEILVSMVIKLAAIAVLGPPVAAVVLFEVVLNATAMFNHSNVRIPIAVDRVLRLVLVTPDMHRVHHSVDANESNSNFGFNLPWWDRLCGTYTAQPSLGHLDMTIGLTQIRDGKTRLLHWMLALPFIAPLGNYAINRRDL